MQKLDVFDLSNEALYQIQNVRHMRILLNHYIIKKW